MKEEIRKERRNWRAHLSRGHRRAKCPPMVGGSEAHQRNQEKCSVEDRNAGRTGTLVKPGGGPGQIRGSFVGQVQDFGLYLNSKWETNRVFIQGRNEDGSGRSQMSELFGKITLSTIWSLNWREVETSTSLLWKSK